MILERHTPQVGAKGYFTLKEPFETRPGVVYTCQSVRTLQDMERQGINVFDRIYGSQGFDEVAYRNDIESGACIVCLHSDNEILYVPDTYIASMPTVAIEPVSLMVVGINLGPLPDKVSLDHLMTRLSEVCSDVVGFEPMVRLYRREHTDALSDEEAANIERLREAAIAIRKTTYAQLQEEKLKNERLLTKLQRLEQYILAHLPPTP